MKTIMGSLVVLAMLFALVSTSAAGFKAPELPYPCIDSPAYTDYIDAKDGPCPAEPRVTPDPMGSW
jgi:predicted small lipoprotein YifL